MRVGRSVSIWGRRTIRHLFHAVHTLIRNDQIQGRSGRNQVVVCEETIQSKLDSIDEIKYPVYGNDVAHTFTGKRINRGLYRSKNGILMNADINGQAIS